jgi:hypothetical protein
MGRDGSRASCAASAWGGLLVSHNGVWRCLCRHGINTRIKRLSLIAGHAAPSQPPREPEPERRVEAERPGELVGVDCFFVGRLSGTKGTVWQLTAIDVASSFAWTELVSCPRGNPTGLQTSRLARRVCAELQVAGWRLERVLTDNRRRVSLTPLRRNTRRARRPAHADPRRPATDQRTRRSAASANPRRVLATCLRSLPIHVRFTGLKRDLAHYVDDYNFHRVHNGRLTQGRIPADIVYGARKVRTR